MKDILFLNIFTLFLLHLMTDQPTNGTEKQEGRLDIHYTDNARKRLEDIKKEFTTRMEYHLKKRKFRKGQNFIEVTTADLDNVFKYYQYNRKPEGSTTVLRVYVLFVSGLFFLLCGMLWNDFKVMIRLKDYEHASMLMGGSIIVALSIAIFFYMKLAEKERKKDKDKRNIKS